MRAFLGYRGVVDHQHGIRPADQLIRLNQQLYLHRPGIPGPGRDEVVQLIVVTKCKTLRHRLNALAIARTDQPRHVERTHSTPRLNRARNGSRKRLSSFFQFDVLPFIGRPSKSRPTMSHRKTDLGIPGRSKSAKVVLGWFWRGTTDAPP